jgi:N-acetyl-alpha-D-muramate 1-phosphate uridylyltransferase
MILAAGMGERMGELTAETPKTLLPIKGRPILDNILDQLAAVGVERLVVNLHHLGEKIRQHLAAETRFEVFFSDESAVLMNTGGGIKKALPLLGSEPFFVINGDAFWLDAHEPNLARLATAYYQSGADIQLLLETTPKVIGFSGLGDYFMAADGSLSKRRGQTVAPFMFCGIYMLQRDVLMDAPAGPFSSVVLFNAAEEAGKLFGVRHDGLWAQLNSPDGLAELTARLAGGT